MFPHFSYIDVHVFADLGSQNMKIICSENAWDFTFAKISCSEFFMFYSIPMVLCVHCQ